VFYYVFTGPLIGWIAVKIGNRKTMYLGVIFLTAGIIGTAYAPYLWVIYIAHGVILGNSSWLCTLFVFQNTAVADPKL